MSTIFGYSSSCSDLLATQTPYIHRDLSWLQFNERVLREAEDEDNPLLERIKFLGITASNLDEFFVIRFPSLLRTIQKSARTQPYHTDPLLRIRSQLLKGVADFALLQASTLTTLAQRLKPHGIFIPYGLEDNDTYFRKGRKLFEKEILSQIGPPSLFNLSQLQSLESLQIGAIFGTGRWFKIPKSLPLIFIKEGATSKEVFIYLIDQLLSKFIPDFFQSEKGPDIIRLTRDGDFNLDFEDEDPASIPDLVRNSIHFRESGRPSRLQYLGSQKEKLPLEILATFKLNPDQLIACPSTLCLASFGKAVASLKSHSHLFYKHRNLGEKDALAESPNPKGKTEEVVQTEKSRIVEFRNPEVTFESLNHQDFLLHHPYDSFDIFISWIERACKDPEVIEIEQTVYRMDGLSPLIPALKSAAKTKRIRVIIELRARFDELNNLKLADDLQKAGIEVAFGFGRLKLHGKVALVTRVTNKGIQRYAHLSTGNYNATTARQYTDLSVMTAHPGICNDVRYFFDSVWKGKVPNEFQYLVPAPATLHKRLVNHIQAETEAAKKGRPARIVAKVNALVDDSIIQELYRASQAGVKVDLIVRSACSLVPGIKGLSENIQVVSIVDRYLEHSRIYFFGDAQSIYLSSADWMPRNFFSRLEIAFPILDQRLYRYVRDILIPIYLSDNKKSHELTSEGVWIRKNARTVSSPETPSNREVRSQFLFEDIALNHYRGTPLEEHHVTSTERKNSYSDQTRRTRYPEQEA